MGRGVIREVIKVVEVFEPVLAFPSVGGEGVQIIGVMNVAELTDIFSAYGGVHR